MTSWLFYSLTVWLALTLLGCQSTPTPKVQAGLASLSEAEQQSYKDALVLLKNEDGLGAEQRLARLSASKPDVPEIWLNLALSYYYQTKPDQAQKALAHLFDLRESTHQGHNLAGLIAVQEGEFDLARNHYQRALELQPDYGNALYNLALLHDVYLQQVRPAVEYYRRYLALVPDDQETQAWLENLELSLDGA